MPNEHRELVLLGELLSVWAEEEQEANQPQTRAQPQRAIQTDIIRQPGRAAIT